MDGVSLYMLLLAGAVVPPALFVWYMAHRQRLEEEAEEDARGASETAAE